MTNKYHFHVLKSFFFLILNKQNWIHPNYECRENITTSNIKNPLLIFWRERKKSFSNLFEIIILFFSKIFPFPSFLLLIFFFFFTFSQKKRCVWSIRIGGIVLNEWMNKFSIAKKNFHNNLINWLICGYHHHQEWSNFFFVSSFLFLLWKICILT